MANREEMNLLEYIRMKERFPLESDDIAEIKEFAKFKEDYIKMLKEENVLLEQKNINLQAKLSSLREEVKLFADERGETRKIIREELEKSIPAIIEGVVTQLGIKLNSSLGQILDRGDSGSEGGSKKVLDCGNDGIPTGCSGSEPVTLAQNEVTKKDVPQQSSQELSTRQTVPTTVLVVPSMGDEDGMRMTSPPNPLSTTSRDSFMIGNEPGLDLLDPQLTLFSEMEILAVDDPSQNSSNIIIDDLQNLQAKMDEKLRNRELAIRELQMEDDE